MNGNKKQKTKKKRWQQWGHKILTIF